LRSMISKRCQIIIPFSFHNFDFAPGKNFVQKKSHRLLLHEAVQRAETKSAPLAAKEIC
jgi:hypothetical protein